MTDELPEGWTQVALRDVLEPNGLFDGPFGSNLKTSDYTDRGVRVLRLENVANLRFVEDKETYISEAKYRELAKHAVAEGDIIVGSFVDGAVRVCLLPRLPTKAIAKADCFTVRTQGDLANRRFVVYQLGANATRDGLIEDIHGATRPRITTKQLRDLPLRLPPPSEQRRIVEKVEVLLEQVKRAMGRLERVPLILKRFRQAVLAAACSGELTREWREENPRVEAAAVLLGDLYMERKRDHDRAVERASKNGNRRPTTPKNLEQGTIPDGLRALPDAWTWVLFDDVCDDITVGHVGPMANEYVPDGVPFLRSQNVRPFRFDREGLKFVTQAFHRRLSKSALKPGDLVVVRSGNAGEACVVPQELGEANCADLVVMRPSRALEPHYGAIFINSASARAHIDEVKVGIAQGHYNIGSARQTPMPLPPLAEQQAIVQAVHRLFALADTIEHRVQSAASRANKLSQAILSKAFSGELVPTEAELARTEGRTYETAHELLERVRGEQPGRGVEASKARGGARQRAPS